MPLTEQVLAEWADSSHGHMRVLGSLSPVTKQNTGLVLKADLDHPHGRFVHFEMSVSIKAHGHSRKRQLLLVFPLQALQPPAFTFDLMKISQVDVGSVHEAGLSPDGHVIRAQFTLAEPGYAVLPDSTVGTTKPGTSTTAGLLTAARSLSETLSYTLYMRPSDYAAVGLEFVSVGESLKRCLTGTPIGVVFLKLPLFPLVIESITSQHCKCDWP